MKSRVDASKGAWPGNVTRRWNCKPYRSFPVDPCRNCSHYARLISQVGGFFGYLRLATIARAFSLRKSFFLCPIWFDAAAPG
jgi:hypothetical protein